MNNKILVNGISVLIFRMSLSGIFITAGISHLMHPEEVANRINSAAFGQFAGSIGDPYFLGLITGYFLLIFGLLLFSGVFTRWSALILFMLLIPITVTIQLGNGILHGPLWKNIAIFGGLVFFIVNNPKVFSIYNK
ncbi:DoxX family protein [Lunatibacter salilacus]|uniref:DoxX family protein n=1 Tax=Lunatibacter salilacus TaxID=2483804 RepID=UPI00131CA098|nr:DoxX family protein [Lunatibacter salilacus]